MKKVQEGKLERSEIKKENLKDQFQTGRKKNKKRERKTEEHAEEDIFTFDFEIINRFSYLKVSPPTQVDKIEDKIVELTKLA